MCTSTEPRGRPLAKQTLVGYAQHPVTGLQKDREVGEACPLVHALVSTGRRDRISRGAVHLTDMIEMKKQQKKQRLLDPAMTKRKKSKNLGKGSR